MNNNNLKQPKPINRVVAPIKVEGNATNLEEQKKNLEEQQKIIQENVEVKKEEIKQVEKEKKLKLKVEHDPTTMVFVVILLIILAVLTAFIFFYIVPRFLDVKNGKYQYNDKEKIPEIAEEEGYYFRDFTLSEEEFVTDDNNFNLTSEFNLNITSNGNVLNVYVNKVLVTTCNKVYNKAAVVDDLIIFGVKNNQVRTTKIYAVDTNGNVIKEFYNFGETDGLVTMDQGNSLIFNNKSFVVMTSRVLGTTLIMSNEFGQTKGVDICNEEELNKLNLESKLLVMSNFTIKYEGKHEFATPSKVSGTKLNEYRSLNNYCK